jgi:hypothetical protein
VVDGHADHGRLLPTPLSSLVRPRNARIGVLACGAGGRRSGPTCLWLSWGFVMRLRKACSCRFVLTGALAGIPHLNCFCSKSGLTLGPRPSRAPFRFSMCRLGLVCVGQRGCEALDWRWNDTMSMYLSRLQSSTVSAPTPTPQLLAGWNGTANSQRPSAGADGRSCGQVASCILHLTVHCFLEMAVPDHGGRNGSRSTAEYFIRRTHARLSRWFSKTLVGCKAPPG